MKQINPIRIPFKSVQQAGLELLLEHYLRCTHSPSPQLHAILQLLVAEWLLKVKQKNILEKAQATYLLSPQLRVALSCCFIDSANIHPLALSVHEYIQNLNEKSLRL